MFICQPDIVAIDRKWDHGPHPMPTPAHLRFEALYGALKAAAEATRLRILALLGEAELTVSDLTAILRQSQPRISRHLRLLVEAGLVERFREGSWAFFRLGEREDAAKLARELIARLDPGDATLARDRERLTAVRAQRASAAQTYFRRHAAQWDRIRKLHVADEAVEEAIIGALAEPPIRALLDLGTGTGRMLELFGPQIERGLGLDLSLDMLALARARLDRAGLRHCSVRQGDIYDLALPKDSFDAVVIHQVLHFLDDGARAIHEAARVLRPAGRLLVVDFAPHDLEFLRDEHAHRRLGFAPETVTQWMKAAGLDVMLQRSLAPEPASEGKIAVSLWLGRDPRITLAAPAREVA
jgi:ubiquinone/menaquinone biosynthesis C-methylase UbiE/DNA-binding transcriptional ArsR family regulator